MSHEPRTDSRIDASHTDNRNTQAVLCDGGTDRDPLAAIREYEDAIREKVVEEKDDDLAAWGRVLLALANDRRPDPDDLQRLELPGADEYQRAWDATGGVTGPDPAEMVRQVRRVLEAAEDGEKPETEP